MTLLQILETVAVEIASKEEYLNELDAVMGDGEHGSNMKKCFTAVKETIPQWECKNTAEILNDSGMKLLTAGGGTATTLIGFFMMKCSVAVKTEAVMDANGIASVLNTALEAIKVKSKAGIGDKTLMDALIPAVEAFAKAAEEGSGVALAADAAAKAAADGVKATEQMVAKRGRGLYVGDRGVGTPDPGATSIGLICAIVSECLRI